MAIKAASCDSTSLSPFECIFFRSINLLTSLKVLPAAVTSAENIASQIIKNQQLARNALQKAPGRQTNTSEKRSKEAPSIILGHTEVTLKSKPYIQKLRQNEKLVGL